jgi:hypothetical protein
LKKYAFLESLVDKSQDPGSGINISDPQHWMEQKKPGGDE